jgi:hypothetical protein
LGEGKTKPLGFFSHHAPAVGDGWLADEEKEIAY